MADPRNVAHDKKVMEEKKHDGKEIGEGTVNTPQPGKKPQLERDESENTTEKKNSVSEDAEG